MPVEQGDHQGSRKTATAPSSDRADQAAANTKVNLRVGSHRSTGLTVVPATEGQRPKSRGRKQRHPRSTDTGPGLVQATKRAKDEPQPSSNPTFSTGRQTGHPLIDGGPSTSSTDTQNPRADNSDAVGPLGTSATESYSSAPSLSQRGPSRAGHSAGVSREGDLTPAAAGVSSANLPGRSRITGRPRVEVPLRAGLKLRLRIETQLTFLARDVLRHSGANVTDFVRILAHNYNGKVAPPHPRMRSSLRLLFDESEIDRTEWHIAEPRGIFNLQLPYKLKLVAPDFDVCRNSQWRSHITASWRFLIDRYKIEADIIHPHARIHISLPPDYSLAEIQRIASSVIHFESAFEAWVLGIFRGQPESKSNWLDSPLLARCGKSRLDSIAMIEKARDEKTVAHIMNGHHDPWSCEGYAWDFTSLTTKGTIEFGKAPIPLISTDAINWGELVIGFIQAAMQFGSSETLRRFPSNIRGLRSFLELANTPGLNEPQRWQRLWIGKNPDAAGEPRPAYSHFEGDSKMQDNLRRMLEEDMRRIREEGGILV